MIIKRIAVLFMFMYLFLGFYIPVSEEISSRDHNICKILQGDVLLYIVFVETRESYSWTTYDINSTIDSIHVATQWLSKQAQKNNIRLSVNYEYFQKDTMHSVYRNFSGSFKKAASTSNGRESLIKWSDKVIKEAADIKTKEEFVAQIRNKYNVESVALIFMINNYYKTDFGASFYTESNEGLEFSILSTKRPVIIAQEILHLFGGQYLYPHATTSNKRAKRKLRKMFPYDVMATDNKTLNLLTLGEITSYYVGWTNEINEEYQKLIKAENSSLVPDFLK